MAKFMHACTLIFTTLTVIFEMLI